MRTINTLYSLIPFSTCIIVSVGIWKLFSILERAKITKPSFTNIIVELIEAPASIFSVFTKLPKLFLITFDAVFTDKIFSINGFFRSAQISLFVVALLLLLWYSNKPTNIPLWIGISPRPYLTYGHNCPLSCYAIEALITVSDGRRFVETSLILPTLLAPFLYNFLADWIALMITRRMLKHIAQVRNNYLVPVILLSSVVIILAIAFLGYSLFLSLVDLSIGFPIVLKAFLDISTPLQWIAFPLYNVVPPLRGTWRLYSLGGVFLLSTLTGIVWIVFFSLAVIVSDLSMKFERLGPWIKHNFHVQKQPYKVLAGILVVIVFIPCATWHLLAAILASLG